MFFKVDQSATADLVAADTASRHLRVTSLTLVASATVTVQLDSISATPTTTHLSGAITLIAGVPYVLPFAPQPHSRLCGYFQTLANDKLTLTQVGAGQVSGHGTYEFVHGS